MKNNILVLIIMCFALSMYSQKNNSLVENFFSPNTSEAKYKLSPSYRDTCVSKQLLISTAIELSSLRRRVELQTEMISTLEGKNSDLTDLNKQYEAIIDIQNKEIELYSNITTKFKDRISNNIPWYMTKEFHFIMGVVIGGSAIYLGASI